MNAEFLLSLVLFIILVLVLLVVVFLIKLVSRKSKNKRTYIYEKLHKPEVETNIGDENDEEMEEDQYDPEPEDISRAFAYYLKGQVMTRSEWSFYVILKKALAGKYMVLSKVRVEDFVEARQNLSYSERLRSRGKIKSRHVDFLICAHNSKPLLVVEVDGKSHRYYEQQKRDEFLDSLYREVGLAVKHVPVGASFYDECERIRDQLVRIR